MSEDGKKLETAEVACPACSSLVSLTVQNNRVLNSNFKRHFLTSHSQFSLNQPKINENQETLNIEDDADSDQHEKNQIW